MGQRHSSPAVCPLPDTNGPTIQPILGNLTFHHFSAILSGAIAIFVAIIAIFLTLMHATHFSDPKKQKQIIRIIWMPPIFAVVCFLVCCFNGNPAPYINPGIDAFEAISMASFFLLLSEYAAPEGDFDSFFTENKGDSSFGGGAMLYQKIAFGVTQWVVVSVLLWIATAGSLAAGTYCETSKSIHFAHIWITIIRVISVGLAVISILTFYRRTSSATRPYGALKQFFCVKGLVFLNFIQTFIFNLLRGGGNLHPTSHLSYDDLSNGIPALILSLEIALISPFFILCFPWKQYKVSHGGPKHYQGGVLGIRAILAAANIVDIFIALGNGLQEKLSQSSQREYGRPGYTTSTPNYSALNESEGQYYHGGQEPILMNTRMDQGSMQRT